jgi:hypothetical protein
MNNVPVAAVLSLAALTAAAQTLTSVRVEPASVAAGSKARVIASFDVANGMNCSARAHFGDGQTKDFKVNQAQDAVMTLEHTWARPGTYRIKIEPKSAFPVPKCVGADALTSISVLAPGAAQPACPPGWTLVTRSVNRKTGAFDCSAARGTAVPAERLTCPGELGYYENVSKGVLSCRP